MLIDLGYVAERDVLNVLSAQLKVPIFDGEYPAVPVEPASLPFRFLRAFHAVPVHVEDNVLSLVMADPLDIETQNTIRLRSGLALRVFMASESEIQEQLNRLYGDEENSGEKLIETLGDAFEGDDENIEHLRDLASEVPVIRMVNLIISRAVESRASDIHIEPFEKELRLRYRIDGVLQNMDPPPNPLRAAIISRIKLMAKLNIAERRLPQDGRIKLKVLGKEIDLRVSTLPTMFGESVVMRILDRSNTSLIDLRRLGFPDDLYEKICQMTSKPHGIFLVTGPTGSGKSTTLYSALKRINIPDRKIITIEDPVEYQMEGINQIHVNPQIGLTFAAGLRHIVRQDPDIIMVGEIRDLETADIAIRSALTGHLVFSTLHTNDAPSAVTRLVDMGVEDYLLASSLIGILAQRLVRVNCKQCKKSERIPAAMLRDAGFDVSALGDPVELQKGSGCQQCDHTGYESRIGIFELLDVDDEMRRLIVTTADSTVLKAQAVRSGMRTLKEDGWNKVQAGITMPDEVLRVTQEV
ncbi:MAG: type II secretion system protein GspE [Acidobacteria bacterium]|nr:MAG: type II secretion system protein GspE [Acidobacteriota bacterium]